MYALDNWMEEFDPFTDANDCETLIKHLNGLGHPVKLDFRLDKHVVRIIYFGQALLWTGDNWMHGVCELALKVIGDDWQRTRR